MGFDSNDGIHAVVDSAGRVFTSENADPAETELFLSNLHGWVESADVVAMHSLFPLAVTILIIHELWTATQEDRAFRVGWVGFRIIGFSALLLGYSRIVGVLTGIVGGGGAWPAPDAILGGVTQAGENRIATLIAMSEGSIGDLMEELPTFLLWMLLYFIDLVTAFFAVAAATILAKFQSIMLIIFISAGKTCIVLSIVPGVAIAKSWAKALATVAAWGWMAGLVFSAVNQAVGVGSMFQSSASLNITFHLGLWLYFVTLGVFTLSIPKFVGALTSGAVSGAPSLSSAVGAFFLAKGVADKALSSAGGAVNRIAGRRLAGGSNQNRASKVSRGDDARPGGGRGGGPSGGPSGGRSGGRSGGSVDPKLEAKASRRDGSAHSKKSSTSEKAAKRAASQKAPSASPSGGVPPLDSPGATKKPGGSAPNDAERAGGKQGRAASSAAPASPAVAAPTRESAGQAPSSGPAAAGKAEPSQSAAGHNADSSSRQEHAAGGANAAPQSDSRSPSNGSSGSVDAEFSKPVAGQPSEAGRGPSQASAGQPSAGGRDPGHAAAGRSPSHDAPRLEGVAAHRDNVSAPVVSDYPAPVRERPSRKQDR